MISSSLIISTYNWPEALALSLKSILCQKQLPNEIIIADDGSDERTAAVIKLFQQQFSIPLIHVWHEDKGFRLAAIRNKAIAVAMGDYIIQTDGDIILHPLFIKDHLQFAKKDSFVRASRIYLDKRLSARMLTNGNVDVSIFIKGVSNITSALRAPLLWPVFETTYKNKDGQVYEIHGCNMAFWKKDAVLVNGYNEAFEGWGPEDKEFVARLLNVGRKKRFLKLGGIAYHLYHEEIERSRLTVNEQLLREAIINNRTFCKTGLNQYFDYDPKNINRPVDQHL